MRSTALVLAFALASCAPPTAPKPPSPEASSSASASSSSSSAPSASAGAAVPEAPAAPEIELVAVDPTPPDGAAPRLSIAAPRRNQIVPRGKAAAFAIKLSATGLSPGGGQHLCVLLDKRPCRTVEDVKRPLLLGDLDPSPDDGHHVITVVARRASGELVRPSGKRAAFASVSFFVGKRLPPPHKDGAPMVLFSPPEGGVSADGLLLDYYVANTDVAEGKVVVHASVGGPGFERGLGLSLSSWKPLRVKNARPGEYIARFSLYRYEAELGPSGSHTAVTYASKPVPGPFAEVTRSFHIAAKP